MIRSAYGISFDQFNREGGENLLAYNGPYIINSTVNQVAPFAFTGTKQPLCTGDNYVSCFRTVRRAIHRTSSTPATSTPRLRKPATSPRTSRPVMCRRGILMCNAKSAKTRVLTLSYIGEHGVHVWVLADLNQAAANRHGRR